LNAVAPVETRPRYLGFLPNFLFDTDSAKHRYILRLWLLALIPSLLLSGLLSLLVPGAEGPELVTEGTVPLLLIVVVAPLLETLIMGGVLLVLRRFVGFGPAVVVSALLWAIAHSLSAPIWGLVVWWPFLIFSAAFLVWRQSSLLAPIAIVTMAHAMQNGTGILLDRLIN
jgi:membrane protease YdiL (CAAX protease family)